MSGEIILAVILGALAVAEVTSVVIQVISFPTTSRRVFRNSPTHHHFELVGWPETALTIRFWLITAIACGLELALSYTGCRPPAPDRTRYTLRGPSAERYDRS